VLIIGLLMLASGTCSWAPPHWRTTRSTSMRRTPSTPMIRPVGAGSVCWRGSSSRAQASGSCGVRRGSGGRDRSGVAEHVGELSVHAVVSVVVIANHRGGHHDHMGARDIPARTGRVVGSPGNLTPEHGPPTDVGFAVAPGCPALNHDRRGNKPAHACSAANACGVAGRPESVSQGTNVEVPCRRRAGPVPS